MRVIAGIAKGRRLTGPKSDKIRPALDSVKEAVFNILFDVTGTTVLDLFAGTGSMGLEALSRGAAHAIFVDNGNEAKNIILKNIENCGFKDQSRMAFQNAKVAIQILNRKKASFDIIFVDPPYDKNLVNTTLEQLSKSCLLKDSAIIIVEHSPRESINTICGLTIYDQRKYGQTMISFLKKAAAT